MADLKFYSEALDDWTLVVTDEATGFPKENMQDRRKDSYWKSNTTSNQNVDFNLGSSVQLDYILLYHNLPLSCAVQPFEATQSNYSDEASLISPVTIIAGNTPYLLMEWSAITRPFWRIKITGLSANAEIFLVFLGLELATTLRYMQGQSEEKIYSGSKIVESLGGIRASRQYHSGRSRFEYAYELLDATNEANLQSLIDNVKGPALPFFMKDIDENYQYVRLMNPRIGSKQKVHQGFDTDRLIFEEEF